MVMEMEMEREREGKRNGERDVEDKRNDEGEGEDEGECYAGVSVLSRGGNGRRENTIDYQQLAKCIVPV